MKQRWLLLGLVLVACLAQSQGVYNYFPPPGVTYTATGGMALGNATAQGAGTLNAQNLYINGVPVSSSSGTVTSVQGAVANGIAVTVSVPSPDPVISVAPNFTGIAFSNGTSFTGAIAANFPTLNQNTTGNAATATTSGTTGAFATTPSTCSSGQAVGQGITAAGAPLACLTPYAVVNETRNTVFAGPTSGTPALPTFRSLVANDLPLTSPITWTGNYTFTPVSGVAITINGVASSDTIDLNNGNGSYAKVIGGSTTGESFGLEIVAGTNSTDLPLLVTNRSGSTQLVGIYGDGGVVVGSPTGGDQGAGSTNTTTLYQAGIQVPTMSYSQIAATGGGCTLGTGSQNFASCARASTGVFNLAFTAAYAVAPVCTVSLSSNVTPASLLYPAMSSNTTRAQLVTYNGSLSPTDPTLGDEYDIVCVGH